MSASINHNEFKQGVQTLIARTSDVMKMVKTDIKIFAVVTLFVWLWMIAYTIAGFQPKFGSHSLVMIKDSVLSSRYVVTDQSYDMPSASSSSNPVLNTMGLLKSEEVSTALYEYLRINYPEELTKRHIKNVTQWRAFFGNGEDFIKAKNEPGTDMIKVDFTWTNPIIAKGSLSAILLAFQESSLDLNRQEQQARSTYLATQVRQVESQLRDIRRIKSDYKSERKISDFSKEQSELAETGIKLANELADTESEAQGKESEYQRYRSMLGMDPDQAMVAAALGNNATLTKLQDQLYTLSQQRALLKSTLTDKNPKVHEVDKQIAQVEDDVKAELKRTLGKASLKDTGSLVVADTTRSEVVNKMVTAQAESIRLYATAQVVRDRMDQVDEQIKGLPSLEEQLSTIEEKESSLANSLTTLRQKYLEAKLKEAETLSNVFVIDKPTLPQKARFPQTGHVLLLGIFLGVAAGVLSVYGKAKLMGAMKDSPLVIDWETTRTVGVGAILKESLESFCLKEPGYDDTDVSRQQPKDVDDILLELFGKEPVNLDKTQKERIRRLKYRLYRALEDANSPEAAESQNGKGTHEHVMN